jgi:hypothetical protein
MFEKSACFMNSQSCGRAPSLLGERRSEDDLSHELRVSDADLEGDAGAVAKSKDVRRVDLEVSKEGRDVVGGGFERDRRIAIGGAAVSLLLYRDDSAVDGEDRQHSTERDLNG